MKIKELKTFYYFRKFMERGEKYCLTAEITSEVNIILQSYPERMRRPEWYDLAICNKRFMYFEGMILDQ